jgi:hypothetical protein
MAEMCPVLSSQIVKKMCLNQKNKWEGKEYMFNI